jgi:predicted GNAT family N-acyltransferase
MQYKIATIDDIKSTLKLHAKYQLDTISEEDKKDGFVTTAFSYKELEELIIQEEGLFVAKKNDEVLAYVMSASWEFWSKWAMFRHMIEDLSNLEYLGQRLTTKNSYQYGPICIDKKLRGTSVLQEIFDFALENMSKRYPILVTFVNKNNPRSFQAHNRKLGLDILQEFDYNNNSHYEMACATS